MAYAALVTEYRVRDVDGPPEPSSTLAVPRRHSASCSSTESRRVTVFAPGSFE